MANNKLASNSFNVPTPMTKAITVTAAISRRTVNRSAGKSHGPTFRGLTGKSRL